MSAHNILPHARSGAPREGDADLLPLATWAVRVALPLIEEEHRVAHYSFKDPRRPRSHVPECKPYLDAIAGYRRAVKGGKR